MAEHGGGGGGSGAGFFLALFACVAVAWFFAEMQKQSADAADEASVVTETDSVFEDATDSKPETSNAESQTAPQEEHGVTYYLDEDGNILDVVRF